MSVSLARENLRILRENLKQKKLPQWIIWIGLQQMIYYLQHLTQPVKMKLPVHSELLDSKSK